MMGAMVPIVIALLVFRAARRQNQGARQLGSGRPASCDLPPGDVADRDGATIRSWVLCAGRRATEVQELAAALERANRQPEMAAVLDLWNARRRVETAEPNGVLPAADQREAENAASASDQEARGAPFNPAPLEGVEQGAMVRTPPAARRRTAAEQARIDSYNPNLARQRAAWVNSGMRELELSRYANPLDLPGTVRAAIRNFQEAAGMVSDGQYGCMTYNAMRHFGINQPPLPWIRDPNARIQQPDGSWRDNWNRSTDGSECASARFRYNPPRSGRRS